MAEIGNAGVQEGGVETAFRVPVGIGGNPKAYEVLVGRGLLESLGTLARRYAPAHGYAVISDESVAELYGERVVEGLGPGPVGLFTFPPGEDQKSRATWLGLTDRMLGAGFGRDSAVIALGGGVTGDLGGFVAATYLRGVPVVQVPTSLVAMIDSSVGGKTGVDVPHGKNLVGAFHPPALVVADPGVIGTLPRAERAQGLAEAAKHGAIVDGDYLKWLDANAGALLGGEVDTVEEAVGRSVEIKAGVVTRDEREGGERQILNFGHTLGHAFEAASGFRLSHGGAVAVGMVLEAQLGEQMGVTRAGTSSDLAEALSALGLRTVLDRGFEVETVLEFLRVDKKVREGRPRFVLLEYPGRVARGSDGVWSREAPDEVVRSIVQGAVESSA